MIPGALILDFGGVVSRTMFETHELSEQALGLAPGTLTWRGPFCPESDPLWVEMQDGRITEREYWLTRARETGTRVGEQWKTMADMVIRTRGDQVERVIRPEAQAAVRRATACGLKLAILSNELDLFYGRGFASRLPLLRGFHAICDATYTGILKPDPRAYLACCGALGLAPERCVFVDDQLRNVDGARRVRMQAVLLDVRNPAAGFDEAFRLLRVAE